MSNPDSFINEVNEEVRRDRLFGLFKRYGWIAALVVLLVVGGAAYNEWRKAQDRAEAEAFGDAVIAALEIDAREARVAALGAIEAEGGRAAVLHLLKAAEAQVAGDRAAAIAALSVLEGDASLPATYRQIAALKRVVVGGAEIPLDEREAVLAGLAQPGQALRPLALEQMALLRIEEGAPEAALDILRDLLEEADVTPGLRQRASQLIVALEGIHGTG
ncbi:hypothetical protein [Alkalilacustris brevis]|uniref:hypothetical protein n=1 Tax=Alkalilacustris brevis TaxID=2026338 RepID=UPI000E0D98B8|nr:hypothetical protein [Alkalilacustris brevis]